jgi:hypothetical protein
MDRIWEYINRSQCGGSGIDSVNESGSEKVKVAPKNDERKSVFSYSKSCMTILSGELKASPGTWTAFLEVKKEF